jgi:glycosyltransferase involved in cell wall biosynthesis
MAVQIDHELSARIAALGGNPSVGLVHDYLLVTRGAERAFSAIAACWPNTPIYTLLYDERGVDGRFDPGRVRTSYLQRLGPRQRHFRALLPFFPHATERLPVQEHDLIISSSSAFAHGVRPRPGAIHVCYCYTPFRYAWHEYERTLADASRLTRPVLKRLLDRIRAWDVRAAARVSHFIAVSETSRRLIAEHYGREARVIPPPVEVHRFSIGEPEDFLLLVSQLNLHKRAEVALEAARRAGTPIRVVGDGPDRRRLKRLYGDNAQFLGRISDAELAQLYARARALVVPSIEEFGIAAVEAQAAGRPVIAPAVGGATETVIDGETGVLVPPDDVDAFAEAMRETDFDRFDPARLRANAERFSVPVFKERFIAEVGRLAGNGGSGDHGEAVP